MTTPWRVYIRDPQLRRVALLEDYSSLDLVLRFNDVSTWQLNISARSEWAGTLAQDGYGIQVYRGAQYILSGMWSKMSYQWDKDSDDLTFSGEDENVWFKYRLALPDPTIPDTAGTWTTVLEDVTPSAAASSVLAYIAQRNLGVNSQPHRKVTPTSTSSAVLGTTMVQRARWQNLLTFCQETATAGGAGDLEPGFRIVQEGLGLQLQVYRPTDRTDTIKLSPVLGNVGSITYERTAPEATAVYVGGTGDGAARTYIVKTSPELAVWGRRESDLANASSNVLAELTVEADKVLAEKAPKQSLSVSPIDIENMEFGTDYFVGDKVTAVLNQLGPGGALKPGDAVTDILREVQVTLTAEGAEVVASVGQNGTGYKVVQFFARLRNLATRLVDVERR